ncbi:ATP-dependent metallopeptidase HflB [Peptoanaerobacter stomatis]|uniref:ATP-dependent metallopeptidase HflB n=1 Tax=Peptoanaerobacter stomatis TaxID=796937 RepID=V9HLF9_9FIRM|nr:AAA family ATPase [Peptoanaerobacter stomatis]EHL18326.1 ATP-dependent metallopeptidase HflB [Peptoanaerobacter stomatis]
MKKNNNNDNNLKKYFTKSRILTIIAVLLFVAMFFKDSMIANKKVQSDTQYIPYDSFVNMVDKGEVEYVFINGASPSTVQFLPTQDYLKSKNILLTQDGYYKLTDELSKTKETTVDYKIIPTDGKLRFITENPNSQSFKEDLLKKGIRVFSVKTSETLSFIFMLLLNFFPFILMLAFIMYFQRRMEPADSEVVTTVPDTKFQNIAGYETLKSDSKFILDFLKNPQSYEKIGARLPNGVLFYGPPGTGKTLMARAIAGEASVPFYKVNGSDFVELYVGLGARRVRKLYKTARENAPCIVFIDEIDSIGGARGAHRGSSEDDKTLTALLNELDGFSAKNGVITIAATNRLQDLDPALVRPGRFDRQVAVPLPNKEERIQILDLYKEGKKMSPSIDIDKLAAKTIDFSPSELENLLNESAIKAVTRGSDIIEQEDIDDSYLKIIIKGDKKEDKHQTEEEKKIIAYHEAGHAVIGHLLGKPILEVSVIGTTSGAGGYTLSQPKEGLRTKSDMKNEIKELYGGRAGETMIASSDDEITVGAVNDIQRATRIINSYIKILGLNGSLINLEELGMKRPTDEIIEQAEQISNELFEETLDMLKKNKNKLDTLANMLMDKSLIDADTFLSIMNDTKEEWEKEEKVVDLVKSDDKSDETYI